jgi:hypothetical protein
MARPKKKIDNATFEGLCSIQATKTEICAVFGCDEKTITRWCKDFYQCSFSEASKRYGQVGLSSLRRFQFKQSEKNPTMAIWLGKQYLGQKDKSEIDNTHKFTGPSPIRFGDTSKTVNDK